MLFSHLFKKNARSLEMFNETKYKPNITGKKTNIDEINDGNIYT